MDRQAAVFVSRIGDAQLVLCGSAQYMLDRQSQPVEVTHSMSAPSTIGRLLTMAATGKSAREGWGPRLWGHAAIRLRESRDC